MYESFWQLEAKPFETGCDPKYFFSAEAHQAALLKLRYTAENRRGGAVLAGAPGVGKSLLVQLLRHSLDENVGPIVQLLFPRMATGELLAYLADELCESPLARGTPGVQESVRRIQGFLAKNAERGRHALVFVEEAHSIEDADTLEALRMLLNFEFDGRPALTFVLVGQPGLLTTMQRMPHLEERLDVKCLLRPFVRSETAAYVEHRLRTAGAAKRLFSDEALDALHEISGGIPRRINRLCDLALLIGYAEELDVLAPSHLHSVQRELVPVGVE